MAEEKKEVLILDERTDSLMELFDLVYGEGFEATGVSSEREALSCVARRSPDVLIDHLQDSTTEEPSFIERLRRLSPRTRIILLSGRPSDATRPVPESAEEAVQWISGPAQESQLLDALDRAMQAAPDDRIKADAALEKRPSSGSRDLLARGGESAKEGGGSGPFAGIAQASAKARRAV